MTREKNNGCWCAEMALMVFDLMACTILETLSAFADDDRGFNLTEV